tara:strand:- start:213 stop:722 length:510 start_codon:yes stop_codon:yes gene_type:complete
MNFVKDTPLGKGLFSKKDIKRGEKILKFSGPIVNGKEALRRDLKKYGRELGNALQVGKNRYIYLQDPGRIVNHSCNPNAGIKDDVFLVAIKNITKGKQIIWDYATSMDEDYPGNHAWTMKCKCRSKFCRKIVKDFKYLPKRLQQKYLQLGIVQKFISKKYKTSITGTYK